MAASTSLLTKSGIGQLNSMLEGHLQRMQNRDSMVEQTISTAQTVESLRAAKEKALENEKVLLLSIMEDIDEMNQFLKNIILIENLFNSIYQPFKKKQEAARSQHAPDIAKYERKDKPQSYAASFVELIFAGQTHLSSFTSWLQKVVKQCEKEKVNIVSYSGAKVKRIERAFYKAFYVYAEEEGFKQMTDILRCSFVFDDMIDLYKCFSIIELLAEQTLGGILRVKDRYHPTTMPFGYRDLLINVYCPSSKIVAEIQLHFVQFYTFKKVSHKMYKRARLFERDTGNIAYQYATKYLRPKIGSIKTYKASEDELEEQEAKTDEVEVGKKGSNYKFGELLKEWGLEKYTDKMKDEGWDDWRDWKDLTEQDLKDDMGFAKGHIRRFMRSYAEWTEKMDEANTVKKQPQVDKPKQVEAVKPAVNVEFVVVAGGKVVHESKQIASCKEYLMKNYGRGASNPQRMVCEVRNGKVNDDPHTCGDQDQGGGLKTGFNKWWNGWDAIHEMNAIAQKHCVKPVKFVVVAGGQVVHESKQIATCKEYLMKNYGRGASNPQRMVCEVRNGKVNDDPHTCGGQNQGGGLKEGFNKWWNGWGAIREMNAIAQKHCVKPVKFVVVAGGQVVHESKQIATCKEYLMK
eukprot:487394_1